MGLRTTVRVVARTPVAPVAVFPKRAWRAVRHSARATAVAFNWLFDSREHTNYTYDLTPANLDHLAWFVAEVSGAGVDTVHRYFDELMAGDFADRVRGAAARSRRRHLWDKEVRLGSRIGWYALTRCTRPRHVVEAGIDKGLGTAVLAEALLRNAAEGYEGRITAIDTNPDAGDLLRGTGWEAVTDVLCGDSALAIAMLEDPVDFYIHDSVYTDEHAQAELDALLPRLSERAMLMTARATMTSVLSRAARERHWRYLVFYERPTGHWYPGDAIGIACT